MQVRRIVSICNESILICYTKEIHRLFVQKIQRDVLGFQVTVLHFLYKSIVMLLGIYAIWYCRIN